MHCLLQTVVEVQRGAEAIAENYKHSLLKSKEQYDAMYKRSIDDPEGFWTDVAKEFYWKKQVPNLDGINFTAFLHSVLHVVSNAWRTPESPCLAKSVMQFLSALCCFTTHCNGMWPYTSSLDQVRLFGTQSWTAS